MKITKINAIPKDFEFEAPFVFPFCTLTYLPYTWFQVQTNVGLRLEGSRLVQQKWLPGLGYPAESVFEKEFVRCSNSRSGLDG